MNSRHKRVKLTDWNGRWEGDTYVFPPTTEEQIAIEDHICWITDSKTKRTKRFKLLLERYMEEWHRSVVTKSYPVIENLYASTWSKRMNDVMQTVVKEYKENAKSTSREIYLLQVQGSEGC